MIRDSGWGFEFSWLNFYSWAFSRHDKTIKIIGIINGFVTFKYWFLPFFCSQSSLLITKKSYSWISEKHDQNSINFTNAFDFID